MRGDMWCHDTSTFFQKNDEENWLQNILSKLLFQGVWEGLGYKGMG